MVVDTREAILPALKEKMGNSIVDVWEKSPRRTYITVKAEDIREVARIIFRDMEARFQIASGVDTPTAIEILYHWAFDAHDYVVTLKVKIDREKPEIDSIADICVGAEWIEREMWELLGITFRNHPDMRHLLLLDDWPEGKYPLRRDYKGIDQ